MVVGHGIHPYPLEGNKTAALTNAGIVSVSTFDQAPVVLVASAVPVNDAAMTVSSDGNRIAWVNPADHSLQVFQKDPAGTYLPVLVSKNFPATSLTFSPDAQYLLGAMPADSTSTLSLLQIAHGAVEKVGTIPGAAKVTAWIAK